MKVTDTSSQQVSALATWAHFPPNYYSVSTRHKVSILVHLHYTCNLRLIKEATAGHMKLFNTETRSIHFLFRNLDCLVVTLPGSFTSFPQGLFQRSFLCRKFNHCDSLYTKKHPWEWGRLHRNRYFCWYVLASFQWKQSSHNTLHEDVAHWIFWCRIMSNSYPLFSPDLKVKLLWVTWS